MIGNLSGSPARRFCRLAGAVIVAPLVLLPLGCSSHGGGHGHDTDASSPSAAPTVLQPGRPGEPVPTRTWSPSPGAGYNTADAEFMQMMVPHHAQAVKMSELADTYARSRPVRVLADRIRAAQGPEILAMSAWLRDRDLPVPDRADSASGHGHHSGSEAMSGMLTPAQLEELAAARGAKFDRLFLVRMIGHHQGALAMAGTVATEGEDVRVQELAADIDVTQRVEIDRMRALLRGR